MSQITKKREIISWCLYDFANSSYSAVIAAVVFPVYFASFVVGNEKGVGDLWWGRAISLSMLIVASSSPFIGGIADRSGMRKKFLAAYTLVCVISVALFCTLGKGAVLPGFFLILLANIGMEGGLVFYNSFLPEIAPGGHEGRVSAWGFALGYAGSILSLLIALPLVKAGRFGLVWISVSLFFLLFSLPALFFLPADKSGKGLRPLGAAGKGIRDALMSIKRIWLRDPSIRRFLIAFFLFEDGVNTIIVFSSIFAAVTFHFTGPELIALYLLVQFTALIGALALARPIDLWGAKKVILVSILLWISVTIAAYFTYDKVLFWAIAALAGTGLGTVQAASRALYAKFIPEGKESEYFGVYSMMGKTSAVLGPFLFGTISASTGSERPAVLAVGGLFLLGLLILLPLREQ
jgi:UMF1 family MFS transporter